MASPFKCVHPKKPERHGEAGGSACSHLAYAGVSWSSRIPSIMADSALLRSV